MQLVMAEKHLEVQNELRVVIAENHWSGPYSLPGIQLALYIYYMCHISYIIYIVLDQPFKVVVILMRTLRVGEGLSPGHPTGRAQAGMWT